MFKNSGSHKHKTVDIIDNVMLTFPRTQLIGVPLSMLYCLCVWKHFDIEYSTHK